MPHCSLVNEHMSLCMDIPTHTVTFSGISCKILAQENTGYFFHLLKEYVVSHLLLRVDVESVI